MQARNDTPNPNTAVDTPAGAPCRNDRGDLSPLQMVLCKATREAHRELDCHPLLEALARPGLTMARYGQVLAALHGPHAVLEGAAHARLACEQDLSPLQRRRRLPALDKDLADLGLSPPGCAAELPRPASLGELIGILYVLDSSLLGGRVLAEQVRQQLGEGVPLRFLAGDAGEAEAYWLEFWRCVDRHAGTTEQTAAVAAALAAFRGFRQHLDVMAEAAAD